MNDDQLMTAVRDLLVRCAWTCRSSRPPAGAGAARSSRVGRAAAVAGVAAIAGVTAVAVTDSAARPPSPPPRPRPDRDRECKREAGQARRWRWRDHAGRLDRDEGAGGAIDVTVRQLEDAAGLQAALRADGIPVRIAFQSGLPSDSPPLPTDCANVSMSDEANAKLQAKILGWPVAPVTGLAPGALNGPGIAPSIYPQQIPRGIGLYLAVQSRIKRPALWLGPGPGPGDARLHC